MYRDTSAEVTDSISAGDAGAQRGKGEGTNCMRYQGREERQLLVGSRSGFCSFSEQFVYDDPPLFLRGDICHA